MRYYIRNDENTKVEGPFAVEALIDAIQTGRIPPDALASSDLGHDVADLEALRSCDWFPLAAIAELREFVPPLRASPPPRRVTIWSVLWNVALALCFSYLAVTVRKWFILLLAVLMVYSAVHAIIRFVRQREALVNA